MIGTCGVPMDTPPIAVHRDVTEEFICFGVEILGNDEVCFE